MDSYYNDMLSSLGEEVYRLQRRISAIDTLLGGIDENFTENEHKELLKSKQKTGDEYEDKKKKFKEKMRIYDTEIKSLNIIIQKRACVIDNLYEHSDILKENIDLVDIFKDRHDALVQQIEKSKELIEE